MKKIIIALLLLLISSTGYSQDFDYVGGYLQSDAEILSFAGVATPATATTNQGRMYYNPNSDRLKLSENNGAFNNIITDGRDIDIGVYTLTASGVTITGSGDRITGNTYGNYIDFDDNANTDIIVSGTLVASTGFRLPYQASPTTITAAATGSAVMVVTTASVTMGTVAVADGKNIIYLVGTTDMPADNEIPKYDAATGLVTFETDSTGAGSGSGTMTTTQEGDVTVTDVTVTMDFGTGFDLTESPDSEVNVALDLVEFAGAASFTTVTAGTVYSYGNIAAVGTVSGATVQMSGENVLVPTSIDTSSEIATIVTNETGSGYLVFSTAPTIQNAQLITPNIGVATGTSLDVTGTVTGSTIWAENILIAPYGANPTVATSGQISVDTSAASGSMIRFYGDAEYAISAYDSKGMIIATPITVADDYAFSQFIMPITIRKISILATGGTTFTGGFDECSENGESCVAIDADIVATAGTMAYDDGSLSNAAIDAFDVLSWHTTSISGNVSSATITVWFTYNPA